MRGDAARAALARIDVHPDDHVFADGAMFVVMTIECRVRHVLLLTGDEGVVVGDSSTIDAADVTCLRCGTEGHRSDSCDRAGVMLSDRVRKQRKREKDNARWRSKYAKSSSTSSPAA